MQTSKKVEDILNETYLLEKIKTWCITQNVEENSKSHCNLFLQN